VTDSATKACPERTRGQELALAVGKSAVFAAVGYGTWRLLDVIFKRPERPIVVMVALPEEDEE